MTDHTSYEPDKADVKDVAEKTEAAGIADEGAAYTKAIKKDDANEPEAHPS